MNYFLSFLIFLPAMSFAKHPSCPARQEMNLQHANPVGIKSYVEANGIKTMEDLICCLPAEYRNNYVIAHSSIAGQNSKPQSPRLLLFNDVSFEKTDLKSVLSINGGDPSLDQSMNLEIMNNNLQTKELELFDYHLQGQKFKMSEKNPEACMSCHGNKGEYGYGGPHPNFEGFGQWSRFKDGFFRTCFDEERAKVTAMGKMAAETLKINSRFKCLKPRVEQGSALSALDDQLQKLESRRIAKILRNDPAYKSFKYAYLGAAFCDDISDWIPSRVTQTMQSTATLQPRFARASDLEHALKESYKELLKQNQTNLKKSQGDEFHSTFSPFARCLNTEKEIEKFVASVPDFPSANKILDKYRLEDMATGNNLATIRYIAESRGISLGDVGMNPNMGKGRSMDLVNIGLELLHYESDPEIKNLELLFGKRAPGKKSLSLTRESLDNSCNLLKRRSLQALAENDSKGTKSSSENLPATR